MRYNITREALLKDYSFFDPLTSDTMIKMHGLKGEALLAKEDIVLDRLNIILEKANFKMLTAHEACVDLATSANYKLKSDVQVDEAGYDPKILERFFRRHRTEFVYRADETDFFLVYYRGVGIAQQTDLFVVEKLELILDRIKFRIKEFVIGLIYKDKKKAQDKLDGLAVSTVKHSFEERRAHGVKVLAGFIIFIGIVHEFLNRYEFGFMEIGIMILVDVIVGMSIGIKYFVPTEKEKFAASPRAQLIQKRKEWREANPRPPPAEGEIMNKIERLRLDQLSLVPGDLLLPNTIQEPTFSEMIVIHREKGSKHIKISEYQDIPMADLELIYPLKKLLLNSTDLVFAVVTLIMGISALISGLTVGGWVLSVAVILLCIA
ncbi:hypothetical protein SARC_05452 [Sphaeroforma arctica JP610]|uniref:Uncharacterized protein n=1 Tax=Sphaeroforma arctica JP610 TaxID=667725 RepID=A0A0L0FZJ9_9EUKA|nr:hypothetical protein SARC_05452 [Sphaeroforma arctica JP610]KNC82262.1 hypothetical protein SARC_05452 [Sphaeroforma arctica JP610]|eukprot:XP_014156164.1 hypothetical protein SARC_05452 [Sphaeroforma arctica JP610]